MKLKYVAGLFAFTMVFVFSILTMINGWGLEVKSWPWLIGGYFATMFLSLISTSLS